MKRAAHLPREWWFGLTVTADGLKLFRDDPINILKGFQVIL